MNEDVLVWEAYEHEYKKNSSNWYWVVGIITVALIVISIILGDTLFGIVIGLSVLALSYYTYKEPDVIEIEVSSDGVRVHEKMYLFESLNSFYVDEKEAHPKLILQSKKLFMPYIIIHMDGADPYEVDMHMRKHLPEVVHPEPFFHKVLDRIGF